VQNSQDLMQRIAGQPPGSRLEISGWRGSEKFTLYAISDERPKFEK
jgi:hypothetical protein